MQDGRLAVCVPNRIRCGFCPRGCRLLPRETGVCGAVREDQGRLKPAHSGLTFRLRLGDGGSPFARFSPSETFLRIESRGSGLCIPTGEDDEDDGWEGALAPSPFRPEEVAFLAQAWGCGGVFLDTDDPFFAANEGHEILERARAGSLKRAVRTTGYLTTSTRDIVLSNVDAVELVLWGVSPGLYRRHFSARPEPIFETAEWLSRRPGVWTEVTVRLLPGENDFRLEVERTARFIAATLGEQTPVRFVAGTSTCSEATVYRAASLARQAALADVEAVCQEPSRPPVVALRA